MVPTARTTGYRCPVTPKHSIETMSPGSACAWKTEVFVALGPLSHFKRRKRCRGGRSPVAVQVGEYCSWAHRVPVR